MCKYIVQCSVGLSWNMFFSGRGNLHRFNTQFFVQSRDGNQDLLAVRQKLTTMLPNIVFKPVPFFILFDFCFGLCSIALHLYLSFVLLSNTQTNTWSHLFTFVDCKPNLQELAWWANNSCLQSQKLNKPLLHTQHLTSFFSWHSHYYVFTLMTSTSLNCQLAQLNVLLCIQNTTLVVGRLHVEPDSWLETYFGATDVSLMFGPLESPVTDDAVITVKNHQHPTAQPLSSTIQQFTF